MIGNSLSDTIIPKTSARFFSGQAGNHVHIEVGLTSGQVVVGAVLLVVPIWK